MSDPTVKLLTLLNVSAAKPPNPKRQRLVPSNLEDATPTKARKLGGLRSKAREVEREAREAAVESEGASGRGESKDDETARGPEESKAEEKLEEEDKDDDSPQDAFTAHFGPTPSHLTAASTAASLTPSSWTSASISLPELGKVSRLTLPDSPTPPLSSTIAPKLAASAASSALHTALLNMLGSYQDLLYTRTTIDDHETLREASCLHIHNHLQKTRRRVLKNNERLAHAASSSADTPPALDQGFTRPKALILLPFRNSALRWLQTFMRLSPTQQTEHKSRLHNEYGLPQGTVDKLVSAPRGTYPDDHVDTFAGNIDDNFRMGIKVTRKSLKLFSEFYSSDVIVSSPLGLKMLFEKDKNADYLSSIEILAIDQLDAITMQNWEHLQEVFSYLNVLPKDPHGCDFSRVKPWYLDNKAKHLRQTLLFSSYETPEIRALFSRQLVNVAGKIRTETRYDGVLADVPKGIKQTFTRFECSSLVDEPDARFKYFTEKTLPSLLKSAVASSSTMIFVPSYFDYVRVRNHMRKTPGVDFVALNEYSTNQDISRARQAFFAGKKPFLLLTERFHFFRRYKIRGSLTHVLYALPDHADYYPEILSFPFADAEADVDEGDVSARVLFSRADWLRLERVVGTKDAKEMVKEGGEERFTFV